MIDLTRQQTKESIEKSRKILITCNKTMDGDSVSSALAVFFLLKKMGKEASLIFDKDLPKKYPFLPKAEFSVGTIGKKPNLVMTFDLSKKSIKEVYYEKIGDTLKLFVTPNNCELCEEDFVVEKNQDFELIIGLSSPSPESLGAVFEKNPDLFHRVSTLNIDWRENNKNWGAINFVDALSSSSSEILTDFIQSSFENLLDPDIATCLLTGIVENTNNLRNNCSPQTFSRASYLMERGGRQQEIIRYLYKEKSIGEVKLFGRILARLKQDKSRGLSFALLPYDDFVLTGTNAFQLGEVLEEFKETMPGFNPFLLLWENEKKEVWGVVLCQEPQKIKTIDQKIGGIIRGDKLFFRPNANTLKGAEEEILNLI